MTARYSSSRWSAVTLAVGFALALIAACLYATRAQANPFDPPSQAKAQRIIGDAYDARLRPLYPRSGITTRCRGRRRIVCSVHVRRRGVELFWQLTRVNFERGVVLTALSPELAGPIRIPGKPTMYRSRPMDGGS